MRGFMCRIALVFAVGCGAKSGSSPESAKPEKPPVAGLVDLQVLSQDFRANQAAGDEKYTGRRLTAEGYMHKLEKMESGDYRMRFEYFVDGFNMREGNVIAFFPARGAVAPIPEFTLQLQVFWFLAAGNSPLSGVAERVGTLHTLAPKLC